MDNLDTCMPKGFIICTLSPLHSWERQVVSKGYQGLDAWITQLEVE